MTCILQDYDSFFVEIADKIEGLGEPIVPLLQNDPAHSVLLFFNKSEEGLSPEESKKKAVESFLKGLIEAEKVESALKKRSFKDVEGNFLLMTRQIFPW